VSFNLQRDVRIHSLSPVYIQLLASALLATVSAKKQAERDPLYAFDYAHQLSILVDIVPAKARERYEEEAAKKLMEMAKLAKGEGNIIMYNILREAAAAVRDPVEVYNIMTGPPRCRRRIAETSYSYMARCAPEAVEMLNILYRTLMKALDETQVFYTATTIPIITHGGGGPGYGGQT